MRLNCMTLLSAFKRQGLAAPIWLAGIALFSGALAVQPAGHKVNHRKSQAKVEDPIDFNRDIRPILSNKCLACHGNDPKAVRAGLKLNEFVGATSKLPTGDFAIVPGHPEKSELINRVCSTDPDEVMPPPKSNKPAVTKEEQETLARWIKEGAIYKPHWAFIKPIRPALPKVKDQAWPKNEIDYFVLATLERKGLHPSKEADKATLLRRVSLDLTGIPPSLEELDAFTKDKSPNAYEKVVDRLLASPRYGERMAMDWMDYSRYADSNGYQADWERYQWRWRDWVLNAFNSNMPYDQFAVKQLAGDLLPHATLNDEIATGFNRNHRLNTEGGVIPEEWRIENVIDRVETTATVFLGLTAGCGRCHDHKYDPISQKEFYSLCAYFNSVAETGSGVEMAVNHPPYVYAPTPAQTARVKLLTAKVEKLDAAQKSAEVANLDKAQDWKVPPRIEPASLSNGLLVRYKLGAMPAVSAGNGPKPTGNAPAERIARSTGATATSANEFLDLGNVGDFEFDKPFSYALWVKPVGDGGAAISRMDNANDYRGWDLFFDGSNPAVHILHTWPSDALKVRAKEDLPKNAWSHITVTYDGSRKPKGVKMYVDGKSVEMVTEQDSLRGTIHTDVTAKVGRRTSGNQFTGSVDDVALFNRVLTPDEAKALADVDPALPLLEVPKADRTEDQKLQITRAYLMRNDPAYAKCSADNKASAKDLDDTKKSITSVMVMADLPFKRPTHVLIRGQYDHLGDTVEPGVPAALNPLPSGAPRNRLGLAKWIVSPDNPLTARVTVNRWWERFFGTGIVASIEDFGTRADFPSHPELLDWLATEFIRLKWNTKAMLKEMVMSATYRQDSTVSPELERIDPNNRLLARGPRFRLPAEVIRDQAMAFGNMLTEKVGGPSVRPYQPDGIWDETSFYGNLHNYKHAVGPDLHRRSLYTIWKRTAAPPNMVLFDAATRETCRVRRARTDTPLQALLLMNDETYLEAARGLAQFFLKKPESEPARLSDMFRAATSRKPSQKELALLEKSLHKHLKHYSTDKKDAKKIVAIGDLVPLKTVPTPKLAAYTLVASTILNLDETITKE